MTYLNLFSQNLEFIYFSVLLILALVAFLISWLSEPRRLINGILFTVFLILFAGWLTILVFSTKLKVLQVVYIVLVIIFFSIIFIITTFSWLFCFWNAYFVWKHESHTLPNLLTLLLGIGLIIAWVISLTGIGRDLPQWMSSLLLAAPMIGAYLIIVMYNFLVNSLLYQFVPRFYNQDYLIVLGAGLVNGTTVTPLLAGRIERAIKFANKQVKKGHKMPKIIMSGGKGSDEQLSEARAMANYAIIHGIDEKYILLEDKSANTYQNMLYSKELAITDFGSDRFKAKFFSNNYHIFRASLYAKMVDLNANGVGSHTRLYFLPNAIIREFAGVFVMHKKRHFTIIVLITIYCILQAIFVAFS